ncbi:SMI1/KNR4 family protein [Paludisphaera soli]|uniref:SMI1/KNR4 family protein n=1 Tax=Paludisphaera soli TaxID=2712865 RepID=UPI0013EA63E9|nr:SMI1/KNR4 family protein [Paludisphaera soli]
MTLDDVQVGEAPLFHNATADVDEAERGLGTRFPAGYRNYIARFGEGVLADYLRVYPPHQILEGDNNVHAWRERIDEYWFWDAGKDVLTKERTLQCVIVADTLDGDEIVFHPSEPDRLYVLPHDDEEIHEAGDGLTAAIEWLLTAGVLTEPVDRRNFDPFDGRASTGDGDDLDADDEDD